MMLKKDLIKNIVFFVLMIGISALTIALVFNLALPHLEKRYHYRIVEKLVSEMTPQEKSRYYRDFIMSREGFWDVVPEPDVGRIAQVNQTVTHVQAEVKTNNAGMRSSRTYLEKPDHIFRIVCLGDSMVFGEGGREQDRFCNQIEEYYRSNKVLVDDKRIQALAVGLGSWTAEQELSYMISRLSSYKPDIVIVLTTSNDITSSSTVTGKGQISSEFSPAYRKWGSGIFRELTSVNFGLTRRNILSMDITPISSQLWQQVMDKMKRLSELQHQHDAKVLFAVLGGSGNFTQIYLDNYLRAGIDSPMVVTNYFRGGENSLPHDGHPSFLGHQIMANHFIALMNKLEWIPISSPPKIHQRLGMEISPEPDPDVLASYKQQAADRLSEKIVFSELGHDEGFAGIMGGIFPDRNFRAGYKDGSSPWSSIRSAFVLRQKPGLSTLAVKVSIPDRVELFPMNITIKAREKSQQYQLDKAGEHTLLLKNISPDNQYHATEVLLYSDRHFTEIADHRMKSFRLVSAEFLN